MGDTLRGDPASGIREDLLGLVTHCVDDGTHRTQGSQGSGASEHSKARLTTFKVKVTFKEKMLPLHDAPSSVMTLRPRSPPQSHGLVFG